jgi:hypothetical protein
MDALDIGASVALQLRFDPVNCSTIPVCALAPISKLG